MQMCIAVPVRIFSTSMTHDPPSFPLKFKLSTLGFYTYPFFDEYFIDPCDHRSKPLVSVLYYRYVRVL